MTPEDIHPRDQVFLDLWLGRFMTLHHIKQSTLSLAMMVDPSVIHLWLRGNRPVPHNRLSQLAHALNFPVSMMLNHARIVKDGYGSEAIMARPSHEGHASDGALSAREAAVAALVASTPPIVRRMRVAPTISVSSTIVVRPPLSQAPSLSPSEYRLLWCGSTHGTGVHRVHHHGTVSVLGPLGSIAEWTRERDPKPYVRPQAVFPHVVWPTHSPPVPAPVSEPAEIEARPAAPQRDFGHDVLIDPTQWKDDREIPLAGPPKAPTEEVQQTHIRRAQVRRVREVVEAPFVTAHHRGHLALGLACSCETS